MLVEDNCNSYLDQMRNRISFYCSRSYVQLSLLSSFSSDTVKFVVIPMTIDR